MKNLEKYRALLNEHVDGLLLTSRYSRHYGAEFDIAEGVAVIGRNGCRYFTDSRYIEAAQNGIRGFEVLEMNRANPFSKLINEACRDFGIAVLGYEEDYLTVAEFMAYKQKLEAKLVPMSENINQLRQIKEEYELERMRKAQQITDIAFEEVLKRIRGGMTEKELAAELIYCLLKNGGEGLSFEPIVIFGPNTSLPHGVPGDRKLQAGDFITMDFGVIYQGYCSDMTRTVAFGFATDEMRRVYDTVLQAQLAGIAATRAGVTGAEVDAAARKVIEDAGYGPYFCHSYGHSIGMECHEMPACSPSGKAVMAENMVSSAEPGIYIPGKFGVRIEDVVVFKKDGFENLTHSPKNLIII